MIDATAATPAEAAQIANEVADEIVSMAQPSVTVEPHALRQSDTPAASSPSAHPAVPSRSAAASLARVKQPESAVGLRAWPRSSSQPCPQRTRRLRESS